MVASAGWPVYCVEGLETNSVQVARYVNKSQMLVMALSPHIGYDDAAKIAKKAHDEGVTLREAAIALGLLSGEEFDRLVRSEKKLSSGDRAATIRGRVGTILTALAAGLLIYCFGTAAAEPQPAAIAARNPILEPPINPGQTLDVGVSLHILNISSIDEVDEQFTVDGYLLARWIDPRLVFTPVSPVDLVHRPQTGEIWIPLLEMINGAAPRERYDAVALVSPDGKVNYAERFRVVLSARFALRRFPFDKQVLPIIIHPFYSAARYIKLSLNEHKSWAASEFNAYSSLAQWELLALHPSLTTATDFSRGSISEARFEISVTRKSSFYLWKVFLPLLLMVVLSWSVFFVEERDLTTQVTIAVTTILTVIAFAFAISATMPRLPYLTYIDAFFLQCYVFVFVAMAEVMLVHITHRSDRRRDLGVRLRRVSRFAIPAAFALSNILIALHFLG
jgi:hypothetical protein